ncbi:MAG: hypothetical protein F4X14_20180 [Caldilineaceae bacterium SB0661_bin_32]|uniref:DUF2190 family protein n=1 Tax=Caldilineaceae bacterium SB0661_bin_32 TaxID=2605255 RepID=A0A6B1DBJ2_9CHLR|nr:hypothetical protein [Caldilineaceae bacterium SB0661_bin_32]
MAQTQCSDPGTLIAGEDMRGSVAGTLLTINSSGQAVRTTTATDVVAAILRTDIPTAANGGKNPNGRAIPVWPINKAFQVPVLMSAAAAAGRLLVPTTTTGQAGSVANVAGLATNQVAFGVVLEAATAADEVITALAHVMSD